MRLKPWLIGGGLVIGLFLVFLVMTLWVGSSTGRQQSLLAKNKIGVIEVNGPIMDSRPVIDQLIEFRNTRSVRAVILRIDSPGGAVGPSQEIYDEVVRTREIKPVIASMGTLAASGGYYIAAPCNKILANPGTLTGSIGVIMEFADLRELFGKIGISSRVIKSGDFKDIGSMSRPMTSEEKELLQTVIDDAHSQFVEAVSRGRNLPMDQVRAVADGRIFTGRQAQKAGLVDHLGGLQEAIRTAALEGGIKGPSQVIYPEEETPKLVDFLLENVLAAAVKQLRSHEKRTGLQYRWDDDVSGRLQ